MSWLDDVRNAVFDTVQTVINIGVSVVTAIADVFVLVGHDLTTISEYFRTALEKSLGTFLPIEVARWVTLGWYFIELGTTLSTGIIANISTALKTGHIDDLVAVLSPLTVTAMETGSREALRGGAKSLPPIVIALLPNAADRSHISECKYTTIDKIDDSRFVKIWSFFSGHVSAICLINVIVFRTEPNFADPKDLFLTVHEVKHLLQFRDKGVAGFVSDYLDDKIHHDGPPRLEVEADVYACSLIHGQTPAYIGHCPV